MLTQLLNAGDNTSAEEWKTLFRTKTKAAVFSASDIETSKQEFIQSSPAVAVLANRYDGIDFPGNECRKSILVNIPVATNPQEKFFITRLSASRVVRCKDADPYYPIVRTMHSQCNRL